ncbi:hypothetical protein C0Q70_20910 [Pomacea canaliculata]|uniref:Uncharacterized protein n=1 Tax=Pomacea canaliculata TaxID=400727 RepID=A0A2T7NB28_POMCA|nr:WD repeat-containing protein 53-like [Pomacea canaliculata]PVD18361.1 hypothetical protein C0Q70_20910 [Pomacea canaliculata]
MATVKWTGGHQSSVLCVAVNQTTGTIASGGELGELCIWSDTGELLHKYSRPGADCTSVLFSKEKHSILYAAFGLEILMFDVSQTLELVYVFQGNQDEVNQVQLDDKEQFLAACDDSGEIKIFSIGDKKVFKTLRFKHTNICSTISFRSNHPWEIISGGLDCRLIHWNFSTLKCLNKFNMQELHSTSNDASLYMVNPPFVHHIGKNESGSLYACALENGLIAVFDGSSRHLKEKFSLHAHEQGVSQVHFHGDNTLISGGNDYRVIVWDLSKAEQYQEHENLVMNGDCSPEDKRNEIITVLCRVKIIAHPHKVNWLIPFVRSGHLFAAIADQTCEITIQPL